MPAPTISEPVLESGDRLTRDEFHLRYCERADLKKAELVEGVVYVASPVRATVHGQQHGLVMTWLGLYQARHPDLILLDNSTVLLDAQNEVQPDGCLFRVEAGGPRITEDDYVEGAPQLVVEIAASSASYDLHDKMRAYQRNGVREYIVWRVLEGKIDWYRLRDGGYVLVEPDEAGVIESEVFSGLALDIPRMLAGDLAGVLAQLERRSQPRPGS